MKNLCIVIPFRDREHHLATFMPEIKKYLAKEGVENDILIVEQENGKPFNRAKLLNIGFDFTNGEYDNYCFHDVDMIPIESDYGFCQEPTHLASRVEQFGYRLPYQNYFGGVTIFDRFSFKKINGYSNQYWGWGAEDDDIFHRCLVMKVATKRKDGMYKSLAHERVIPHDLYSQNVKRLNMMMAHFNGHCFTEGLSTLDYNVISHENNENCTRVKVSV